jgi:hypothetical protein
MLDYHRLLHATATSSGSSYTGSSPASSPPISPQNPAAAHGGDEGESDAE